MFEPMPLAEMRDTKSRFKPVKEVRAATGVKIAAPELQEVIAGMPIRTCSQDDIEEVSGILQEEVQEVVVETDEEGIVVK